MSKLAPSCPASYEAKGVLEYIRCALEQDGFNVRVARTGDAIEVMLNTTDGNKNLGLRGDQVIVLTAADKL